VESGAYSLAEVRLLGLEVEVRSVQKKRSESDVHDGSGDCRSFHIRVRGEIVGSLKICSAEVGAFGPDETVRLEEIALDLGLGVETLRGRAAHGKLERQLVASQRLEAVGRLAGGVAHDFNNSLAVVLTYSGFARDSLHPSDPACADLEEISRAAEHAAGLTRQLLAFSRKQMLEPKVINLNDIVAGVENMLRRLLGEDILIFVHLDPRLGNVLADAEQLEQVIMNLVVNARDAMPSGGRLAIETDNVILDGEYEEEHASVEPGRYVRLSVTDTGLGMDAETRRRIFEPFFTTKERGSGSGLGLATVYGIVKQSGGNIWVYSEPGQGSTFRIYLPRVDAVAAERKPEAKSEPMVGSEVILLVEDEPCVRRAAERILVSCGYRVCSAGDGESALRLSREFEGPVDLLLTDVVMPKMSGRQLAERLKKERPDIKVLYMSGYTNNTIAQHGALQVGTHFVSKPFAAAELTRKVRQALDEPTDSCEPSA
jgi:signal transduction histidine kinase/CheY-like chemotaxis protein